MPKQTPSQTVGPYFAYGLTPKQYGYPLESVAGPAVAGLEEETAPRIRIEGRVLDGNGTAIDDAMVEIFQADGQGRAPGSAGTNSAFTGFARCGTGTDAQNRFVFETVKPGGPAPHIDVIVFARGLLNHCYTRLYFGDEDNAGDPVLASVPDGRRDTLIAEPAGNGLYRFDIRMQGEAETVFFDV